MVFIISRVIAAVKSCQIHLENRHREFGSSHWWLDANKSVSEDSRMFGYSCFSNTRVCFCFCQLKMKSLDRHKTTVAAVALERDYRWKDTRTQVTEAIPYSDTGKSDGQASSNTSPRTPNLPIERISASWRDWRRCRPLNHHNSIRLGTRGVKKPGCERNF